MISFICLFRIHSQYNCIDNSWSSKYVMHPFWNWLVEVIKSNMKNYSNYFLIIVTCFFSTLPHTVLSHLARTESHYLHRIHTQRLELYSIRILWLWLQFSSVNTNLDVPHVGYQRFCLLHIGWNWWKTSKTNRHLNTAGRIVWSRSRQLQHTIHYDIYVQFVWRWQFSSLSNATHDIQYLLKLLCKYQYHHLSIWEMMSKICTLNAHKCDDIKIKI